MCLHICPKMAHICKANSIAYFIGDNMEYGVRGELKYTCR